MAAVLCPPYDVISDAQRARLAARDARNAVHVELPVARATAQPSDGYRRAARLFRQWQADSTLRQDDRPLIYVYEQRYALAGQEHRCSGFYCLLRLEPMGGDGVRPHERTMSGPKEDRYRLLRAVEANLSPVLLLHDSGGSGERSAELIDRLTAVPAELEARTEDGILHRLWTVDPARSDEAAALLGLPATGPLTIADGHHRYETALRYRAEQHRGAPAAELAADNVLALIYDARSSGLSLLPTHRVISGLPDDESTFTIAQELFDVGRRSRAQDVMTDLSIGRLGLWTRRGGAILAASHDRVEGLLPRAASDALRWLDVTVLSSTLPRLVGCSEDELLAQGRLTYVKDAGEAIALVDSGAADACFLLPPTPIAAVLQIAAAGELMPQKSTYFHPKAATGLVFHSLAK